jgi:hypothetical protein
LAVLSLLLVGCAGTQLALERAYRLRRAVYAMCVPLPAQEPEHGACEELIDAFNALHAEAP